MKKYIIIIPSICLLLVFSSLITTADARPVLIEPVEVQPPGGWVYEGGIDWETGRTLGEDKGQSLDYDNIRLTPVDLQYGYNDWIQFSGDLKYSLNSEDNSSGVPDESGFEGINLETRLQWNENVATSFSFGFLGNDEVFPYSAEGFNFGFNVPGQMNLGPGKIIGELGFTLQTGDATFGDNSLDREGFLNLGLGYMYEVNRDFSLTGELRWQQGTVEDKGNFDAEDHFDLAIGVPMRINNFSYFDPSLILGLADGSPDVAIGLKYGYKFGNQQRYADQAQSGVQTGGRSVGRSRTNQNQTQDKSKNPLVIPEGQQSKQDDRVLGPEGTEYNPERAAQFAQQGRKAFEQGNYQRAIQLYKRATRFDSSSVEYQYNLGSLYYRQENYQKASEHYRQALENDPRDYFSHLYLGVSQFQLGNQSKARQHFKRVLEIQPGNKQAQRWLDRLNS